MRKSNEERVIEKMALLLLSLEPDPHEPDRTFEIAANQASDMAYRANKGWWEIAGKPDFNRRMANLRRLHERRKRK
jgi:hypothetical protein